MCRLVASCAAPTDRPAGRPAGGWSLQPRAAPGTGLPTCEPLGREGGSILGAQPAGAAGRCVRGHAGVSLGFFRVTP